MNKDRNTSDLIAKYITDTLTKEEEIVLNKWLEDPYNKLQFDQITLRETIQRNRKDFQKFDPEIDWEKLDSQISGKKYILHWMKYAAVIILPIGLGILAYMYSNKVLNDQNLEAKNDFALQSEEIELRMHDGKVVVLDKDTSISRTGMHITIDSSRISYKHQKPLNELEYNVIQIPRGKQYQLSLSDGTKVWLNADTRFKYPVAFVGKKREVFIENGEAFFDVTKNKEKPFVVNFKKHKIKVLGTRFNVKSYKENDSDQVTLTEGSIQVNNANSSVELVPNQQAVLARNSSYMKVREVDANIYSAWKNKRFLYKQERLEDIMIDLSRFYNIKVFCRNQEVKEQVFSLRLSQEDSFETILENFELTGKVQFEINKNNIIIQ